ncbi:hypothetical protein J2W35_006912 [Variovorax boronicumulans]|nr:hypothetical protein [Variovorax boronicumulans]
MVFSDDSRGFAFSCEDAKMSICAREGLNKSTFLA